MRNGFAIMGTIAEVTMLNAPAWAQNDATDHAHGHAHAHDHDHAHGDEADRRVHDGYFEDADIRDRSLSDWQGEWQSVYPLLANGALDPVITHKAETGDKSAGEYRAYYDTGYRTDVDRVVIEGDQVTFHRGDRFVQGRYASDGFAVLTYAKGNRGVRFVFEKTSGDAEAPQVIQFSDHIIAPQASDHFHLYWGDDRAALLNELTNWPTYYPAALDADDIVAKMLAH